MHCCFSALNIHAVMSSQPASSILPLGCHCRNSIPSVGPSRVPRLAPDSMSHSRIVPSMPPVATVAPEGSTAITATVSSWPASCTALAPSAHHRRLSLPGSESVCAHDATQWNEQHTAAPNEYTVEATQPSCARFAAAAPCVHVLRTTLALTVVCRTILPAVYIAEIIACPRYHS